MNRVSVGEGSLVKAEFHKGVTKNVCLAGVQPKFEVFFEAVGEITKIKDTGDKTPEGKPDYTFSLKLKDNTTITTRRSNIKRVILFSED